MPTFGAERPFEPNKNVLKKTRNVKIAKAVAVNIATITAGYVFFSLAQEVSAANLFNDASYQKMDESRQFIIQAFPYVLNGVALLSVAAGIGYSIIQKTKHAKEKASYTVVDLKKRIVEIYNQRFHDKPPVTKSFDVAVDVYKKNIFGFRSKKANEGSICLVVQDYIKKKDWRNHSMRTREIQIDGLSNIDFTKMAMGELIPRPKDIKAALKNTKPYSGSSN